MDRPGTLPGEVRHHAEFTERERHEIALESMTLPPEARLYVIHKRFAQAAKCAQEREQENQATLF